MLGCTRVAGRRAGAGVSVTVLVVSTFFKFLSLLVRGRRREPLHPHLQGAGKQLQPCRKEELKGLGP